MPRRSSRFAVVLDHEVQVHGILTAPKRINLPGPQRAGRLPVQADGEFIRGIPEFIFVYGGGKRGQVVRLLLAGRAAQAV